MALHTAFVVALKCMRLVLGGNGFLMNQKIKYFLQCRFFGGIMSISLVVFFLLAGGK